MGVGGNSKSTVRRIDAGASGAHMSPWPRGSLELPKIIKERKTSFATSYIEVAREGKGTVIVAGIMQRGLQTVSLFRRQHCLKAGIRRVDGRNGSQGRGGPIVAFDPRLIRKL